jgi:hypothetical protein
MNELASFGLLLQYPTYKQVEYEILKEKAETDRNIESYPLDESILGAIEKRMFRKREHYINITWWYDVVMKRHKGRNFGIFTDNLTNKLDIERGWRYRKHNMYNPGRKFTRCIICGIIYPLLQDMFLGCYAWPSTHSKNTIQVCGGYGSMEADMCSEYIRLDHNIPLTQSMINNDNYQYSEKFMDWNLLCVLLDNIHNSNDSVDEKDYGLICDGCIKQMRELGILCDKMDFVDCVACDSVEGINSNDSNIMTKSIYSRPEICMERMNLLPNEYYSFQNQHKVYSIVYGYWPTIFGNNIVKVLIDSYVTDAFIGPKRFSMSHRRGTRTLMCEDYAEYISKRKKDNFKVKKVRVNNVLDKYLQCELVDEILSYLTKPEQSKSCGYEHGKKICTYCFTKLCDSNTTIVCNPTTTKNNVVFEFY